jgi:hypothetical protein
MKNYEEEEDFEYSNTEDYLIENWTTCKFDEDDNKYRNCYGCDYYDECLENAEDSRDGYNSFCDCIVGCGYDSMDDFWEHHI